MASPYYSGMLTLMFALSSVSQQLVVAGSNGAMKYRLVSHGMMPIGVSVTVVGNRSSALRCAADCGSSSNISSASSCRGFIFVPVTCDQNTPHGIGNCRLISFADSASVSLIPETPGCVDLNVVNPCFDGNPCLNGGTCNISDWPRECLCPPGYNGSHCQISPSTTSPLETTTAPSTSIPTTTNAVTSRTSPYTATSSRPITMTASSACVFSPLPTTTSSTCKINGTYANTAKPRDCADIRTQGANVSGIYTVYVGYSQSPLTVYCDMATTCGGWTVIQRRMNGTVNFYRNWADYAIGFGDLRGEFWLGNDNISALTANTSVTYTLRFDLADFNGTTRYAEYSSFRVAPAASQYTLLSLGTYSGTAGNSMGYPGWNFTTFDRDNDNYTMGNCAVMYKGAMWYLQCHSANPNGLYYCGPHASFADGIEWRGWTGYYYSLMFTEMKIRSNNFH